MKIGDTVKFIKANDNASPCDIGTIGKIIAIADAFHFRVASKEDGVDFTFLCDSSELELINADN